MAASSEDDQGGGLSFRPARSTADSLIVNLQSIPHPSPLVISNETSYLVASPNLSANLYIKQTEQTNGLGLS
jgi:hypothetical protein